MEADSSASDTNVAPTPATGVIETSSG